MSARRGLRIEATRDAPLIESVVGFWVSTKGMPLVNPHWVESNGMISVPQVDLDAIATSGRDVRDMRGAGTLVAVVWNEEREDGFQPMDVSIGFVLQEASGEDSVWLPLPEGAGSQSIQMFGDGIRDAIGLGFRPPAKLLLAAPPNTNDEDFGALASLADRLQYSLSVHSAGTAAMEEIAAGIDEKLGRSMEGKFSPVLKSTDGSVPDFSDESQRLKAEPDSDIFQSEKTRDVSGLSSSVEPEPSVAPTSSVADAPEPPDIDALQRLDPDEARRVQQYLFSRGYDVVIDGIMGPATYGELYKLLRKATGLPLTARNRRPALAKLFPDVGDAALDALENGVMRAGLRDKSSIGDMLTENERRTAALEAAFGLVRELAGKIVVEAGFDRGRFSGAIATDIAARPDWPRTLETLREELGIDEDEAQEIAAVAEEMGHPLRAPDAGPTEVAGFYPDHPAIEDRLYGKAVASVLATTIARAWVQVHPAAEDKAFMAHLHGPWGSGKSSILRFLEEILAPADAKERARKDYWDGVELERDFLVVKYNAWQHQDMGAPWFTLMNKVYQDACDWFGKPGREDPRRRREIIGRHWVWRLNTGWQPVLVGLAVTVAALVLFYAVLPGEGGFVDLLKVAGGVVTGLLTLFAMKDKLGIVNTRTADTYLEQANNPLPRLTERYHEMISQIGKPVAVFIDDVDRCDANFVVDLLHAIQTFYREAPVVYVVAGDRDWICSAYEQAYEKFRSAVAEPGHSMGHLFLEKLFQVSAEVPKLAPEMRRSFWDELIHRGRPAGTPEDPPSDPKEEQRERAEIEGRVCRELADAKSQADIRRVVMAHRATPLEKAVSGALAFEKSFAPEIERERRHFLADYADRLEPNPRAMKRLLNAYGFRSAYDVQLMEQSRPDALVRWTIFENRWPVWAAEMVKVPAATADPAMLATCRAHVEVREVLAGVTWDDVRRIIGAPAGRGAALLLDDDVPGAPARDNGALAEDAGKGEE